MQQLSDFIKSKVAIEETDLQIILSKFKEQTVKKGKFVLKKGQIANQYFFIKSGGLRFSYGAFGVRDTSWVVFQNRFFTEMFSLMPQKPTRFDIEAVEETVLLYVSKPEMELLYRQFPVWQEFGRKTWEGLAVGMIDQIVSFQTLTAEERYLEFRKTPELLQKISIKNLAGLRETIVDAQSLLLDAAVAAGVPRFISSDYSSDFTQMAEGENRNFDLRKEFHKKLDAAPIASTAIMNGAFANILISNTPFYNLKDNSVAYWGSDANFKVDFTTKDDTAAFTAAAALDDTAPKILRIASFQISPNDLVSIANKIKNTEFKLIPMGSLEGLSAYNKKERAANPAGENELYPAWQGSQYMHSMFSAQNNSLDNNRYPGLTWTKAEEVLSSF